MNSVNKFFLTFLIFYSINCNFANYQKGVEFFDMSRYSDSLKAFKAAVVNKENVGNAYAYMGRIFFRAREYKKAYTAYVRAINAESDSDRLISDLMICMDKLKGVMELSEFMALFKESYEKGIYAAPIVYHLISNHHNKSEFEEVLQIFDKVKDEPTFKLGQRQVAQDMSRIFLYAALANQNIRKNEIISMNLADESIRFDPLNGAARKLYDRLLDSQKKEIETLISKAKKHFNDRNLESAQELYQRVITIKSDHRDAIRGIENCKLARSSYSALEEARQLLKNQKHEAALVKIKWAITAFPENFEAINLKKDIEDKILKKLNIKALEDEARKAREKRYFSLLSQANNFVNNNQFDDAIKLLDEVLQIRPDSSRAKATKIDAEKQREQFNNYEKALNNFQQKKWQEALNGFLEAQKTKLSLQGLEQSIIVCYFRLNNYDQSIDLSKSFLSRHTENQDVLYFLGRSYEALIDKSSSNRELAIKTYDKLLQLDKDYLDTQSRLNGLQRDKWGPIIFSTLISMVFVMLFIWLFKTRKLRAKYAFINRVDKLLNNKNYDELANIFDSFYGIDFNMRETLKYLPNFMFAMVETGRFDQSLKLGSKVLSIMPEHRQVKVLMGIANYQKGVMNPSVIKFYLALIDSEQINDEIITWLGQKIIEYDLAKEETLPILKKFNSIHPEHEACRKALIEFLSKEKIINQQLLKIMLLEIKYNPSDTKCRLRLAEYYLKKKQLDDCVKLCEEVINLNVNDKKLHPILYKAYEAMNNLQALIPLYESLLQIYPNSITLQEARNNILLATGQNALSQKQLNTYQSSETGS